MTESREGQFIDHVVWGTPFRACEECEQIRGEFAATSWERAAGVATRALIGKLDRPPASLMRRLERDASDFFASRMAVPAEAARDATPDHDLPRLPRRPARALPAAVLIAAVVVLGLMLAVRALDADPDPRELRTAMLSSGTDYVLAEIQPGPSDRRGSPGGDVVWSPARQEGYLRLRGLPINDPSKQQYQLWIIDAGRVGSPPVDGGVFDIPATDGDVVIPIRKQIAVRGDVKFAITLEPAGGVVVSDQEHVVAVATP